MPLSPTTQHQLLQLYPALSQVDPEQRMQLLDQAQLIQVGEKQQMFRELAPCTTFPFVLSGRIRVFKQAENGREITLYKVGAGDACVVTAACLLGNQDYNAVAVVQQDCALVMLPQQQFDQLLIHNGFRHYIFGLFSQRVVQMMQLIDEVAFQQLDRRLASLLLSLGREIHYSQQQLADELGTVREIISRLLSSFVDSGLITLGRTQIRVIDSAGLEDISKH